MSTSFSLFPDDDPSPPDARPTLLDANEVRDALAAGDLDSLETWMEQSHDMTAALRRIHSEAETAVTVRVVEGQALTAQLVAWPFMAVFEHAGRVPAAFDIGPSSEPFGKRLRELWSKMVAGENCQVMPYRFAIHAHSVFGIKPTRVYKLVQDTVQMLGKPDRRVPAGFSEFSRADTPPYNSNAAIAAPVLLMAAVFSPSGGPAPSFVHNIDAMSKASDLLAGKLGLRSGTPKVRSLVPSAFYGALERLVEEDFSHTARVVAQPKSSVSASFNYDCTPGHARVMSRNTSYFDEQDQLEAHNLAFDATWLDYVRMTEFLKRLAAQQKRGAGPVSGIDPSRLN